LPFALRFENGLQIIFLRDGDRSFHGARSQ
jgi:hypothetical protein